MMSLAEAAEALAAAQEATPVLGTVVMMTVGQDGRCLDGTAVETAAARLTELGADVVGCNCSYGPESVLAAIERMRTASRLPLAAMPSGGQPEVVDGRSVYRVLPEDMAAFARRAMESSAGLIGGCCGTTPAHIRAMREAVRAGTVEALPM